MDEFSPDNPFAKMNTMFSAYGGNKHAQRWEAQNKAKKAATQAGATVAAGSTVNQAGMASLAAGGAQTPPAAPPAPSATDTSGLEARIAALEASGSNTPSAPSSMSPQAIATGEAIYGTPDQRNSSINPFNSALI